MNRLLWATIALAMSPSAFAQDARAWAESQNLDVVEVKPFQDLEAVVVKAKGAADAKSADERLVILKAGKPQWQSNPKETEPGSHWTIHAIGRDLDGDGQPDLHASSFSGGAKEPCFTTHLVLKLKPVDSTHEDSVDLVSFLHHQTREGRVKVIKDVVMPPLKATPKMDVSVYFGGGV